MIVNKLQTFNLGIHRPNVLLLGNGLFRESGISWDDLLQQTAREGISLDPYAHKDDKGKSRFYDFLPNHIRSIAITERNDAVRREKYAECAKTAETNSEILSELCRIPFDAILTTNYTYEIEQEYLPGYESLSDENKRKLAYCTVPKYAQRKFLLHTCNKVRADSPEIWHIHGELRRKTSVVMTLDEYARLICSIVEYNRENGDRYRQDFEHLEMRSWIDYLIMGNIHILGLSLDYSEFSLWWMLNRRLRETADVGEVYFYQMGRDSESESDRLKRQVLQDIRVNHETCGFILPSGLGGPEKNKMYDRFYRAAVNMIMERVSTDGAAKQSAASAD